MCRIHGGKGKPAAGNLMGSFTSKGSSCAGEWDLPAKAVLGRKGGLCVPSPRQRCLRCWAAARAASLPLPRSASVPALSEQPEHNAPFTPRQTGGLDALPAFCCQGHRLGSVPSSFSLH